MYISSSFFGGFFLAITYVALNQVVSAIDYKPLHVGSQKYKAALFLVNERKFRK